MNTVCRRIKFPSKACEDEKIGIARSQGGDSFFECGEQVVGMMEKGAFFDDERRGSSFRAACVWCS